MSSFLGNSSKTHHEHTCLLPIHEALGNRVGCQDLVSEEGKRSLVILSLALILECIREVKSTTVVYQV
jgi:hypothetical protein